MFGGQAAGGLLGVVAVVAYVAISLFLTGLFIVLSLHVYTAVINHFHNQKTTQNMSGPVSYVSTQDGFQIKFPYGTPIITNSDPTTDNTGITQSTRA